MALPEDILTECDIDSAESFKYFEQFAALMEYPEEIDYDTFIEIFMMPEREELRSMTESFFEDLIKGIPDDDLDLYSAVQSFKDTLILLSDMDHERSFGFYADILFSFRSWLHDEESVNVHPESGGAGRDVTPLEALMLYREEKLSGTKYEYDFSNCLPEVGETMLEAADELKHESGYTDSGSYPDYEYEDDYTNIDDVLRELPDEYDPDSFDRKAYENRPIDPYTEGFVDRDNPVIVGPDIDMDDDY
ncbi:MAG: hypothetical protein K5767_04215 [Clostridia bacterium]|nr:hypothetical protein [Clostridia bacterium]